MSESNNDFLNVENNGRINSDACDSQNEDVKLEYSNSKDAVKPYSDGSSVDFSPSGCVFESDDLEALLFENDEHESGVESVDGDWLQLCNTPPSEFELDLTEEQALETLKYFTLSLSRANQMTKTHQDLEAVLQLLQEKEKDLELAAHIGQSLLERNRNLYKKTEALENYVNEVEERETQLKHVVTMKDKLLKTFMDEDLDEDEDYSPSDSSAYDSCRDESMLSLQEKCDQLEQHNTSLIIEALKLREETDKEEEKEKELVYECIKELGEAKDQISYLTDEISMKAQDNIAQQEEITKLIDTVLELQERHNALTVENEDLQENLKVSQENQKDLKVEVTTLHEKYQECFEMLMENQREMKMMKEKMGSPKRTGHEGARILLPDPRDSLAQEIEESVRRDIETSQEKKKHADRVMQIVRVANAKRFPKAIKAGTRPAAKGKSGQVKGAEKSFDFSFATSPRDEQKKSPPSMDELRAAVRRLSISDNNVLQGRSRRTWAPEKLQIVKPMEGSATLHKWQTLAKPTMSGLHSIVPGVHVKGEITRNNRTKHESNQASTSKIESDTEYEEHAKHKTAQSTKNTSTKIVNKKINYEGKIVDKTREQTKAVAVREHKLPATSSEMAEETRATPYRTKSSANSNSVPTTVGSSNTNTTTSSNLTEIVKSKLPVLPPATEQESILNTILRSTVGITSGLVSSTPVTTTAKSSFVTTTTTSSSIAVSALPRSRHVRSRSSENLLNLIAPFNQGATSSSTESFGAPFAPAPVTQSSSIGGFVGRLVRSSSNENLAGSSGNKLGFSRSASSGKLSDLLKNSDIAQNIGKASSVDTMKTKRASFHLGDSPPSAPQLEMMGDLGGFAFLSGGGNSSPPANSSSPANEIPPVLTATSTTRSMFGVFSGLGGLFRPRSKSLDNLGPLPTSITAPRKAPVERSLERFDQVFGPG